MKNEEKEKAKEHHSPRTLTKCRIATWNQLEVPQYGPLAIKNGGKIKAS